MVWLVHCTTPVVLCTKRARRSLTCRSGMLLEPSSEASLGLSDVDLPTHAWYPVYDVCLLLDGERVFDLSKHGPENRA